MKCIALYECAAGIQRAVREDGVVFTRYKFRTTPATWGKSSFTRADVESMPDYHLVTPTPRVRLPKFYQAPE